MSNRKATASARGSRHYVPPPDLVLSGLGVTREMLLQNDVTVSSKFLQFLISKLASLPIFDGDWYAKAYPDVEGARVAGEVSSLPGHFVECGYIEGRLPFEPPFDPNWYYEHYKDIAEVFARTDTEALRNHFMSKGHYEGRIGSPDQLGEVAQWLSAVSSSFAPCGLRSCKKTK